MRCAEHRVTSRERGMALALALFALVVIGGIVSGGFYAGMLEQQSGRNTLYLMQAAEAAEAELPGALAGVPPGMLASLPVGGAPWDLGPLSPSEGVRVARQVARLTDSLFLLLASGSRLNGEGAPLATRAIGMLLKLATDSVSSLDTVLPLSQRAWVQLY